MISNPKKSQPGRSIDALTVTALPSQRNSSWRKMSRSRFTVQRSFSPTAGLPSFIRVAVQTVSSPTL